MKLAPSIVKAAGLAIAGGLGFAIGSWGEARIQPTGSSDAGGEAYRGALEDDQRRLRQDRDLDGQAPLDDQT